jgi:hypothetical protein
MYKGRLPIKRHESISFLYLEDKDYREIAETLGISEVNARVKNEQDKETKKNIKSLRSMKELDLLKDWQRTKILLSRYQK